MFIPASIVPHLDKNTEGKLFATVASSGANKLVLDAKDGVSYTVPVAMLTEASVDTFDYPVGTIVYFDETGKVTSSMKPVKAEVKGTAKKASPMGSCLDL